MRLMLCYTLLMIMSLRIAFVTDTVSSFSDIFTWCASLCYRDGHPLQPVLNLPYACFATDWFIFFIVS